MPTIGDVKCEYCGLVFAENMMLADVIDHADVCEAKNIEKEQLNNKDFNSEDPYGIDDNSPAHTNNYDE